MGTRFELVLPAEDHHRLRTAGEAALEEIGLCHQRFNRFDEASLLNHVHRTAVERPVPLDRDTFALFADAVAVWSASGGAFDPTTPCRRMDAVMLDPVARTISLSAPGVRLDLGAIAKGHAIDLAARVLRDHGVTSAFLHGGTSSALGMGTPPAGEWRVALGDGVVVTLQDQAMSVSAVWPGNPHPTTDPRTGKVLDGPRRAVVVGPSARLADAWSTATLVLGKRPDGLGPDWTAIVS
jgi:thiamine biosynthesis lipoprotein